MQISYVPTQQDFIDAQRAHAWRKYKPSTMRAFSILYPLLGIVLLLEVCWLFKLEKFGPTEVFLVVLAVYLTLRNPS